MIHGAMAKPSINIGVRISVRVRVRVRVRVPVRVRIQPAVDASAPCIKVTF